MCGETLSDAVIVERRNGPRRLRANDDDPIFGILYRLSYLRSGWREFKLGRLVDRSKC